jgi:hypothetical protein
MTRDAKESLTALISVSAMGTFSYAFVQMERRFEMSGWLTRALQGISLALLLLALTRAAWRGWGRGR